MKVKSTRRVRVDAEPVYDLSVPGTQNFCLANGCVVHNSKDCSDSLAGVVYGLTTRREIWLNHGVSPASIPSSVGGAGTTDDRED